MSKNDDIRETILVQGINEFKSELHDLCLFYLDVTTFPLEVIKAILNQEISRLDVLDVCIRCLNINLEEEK